MKEWYVIGAEIAEFIVKGLKRDGFPAEQVHPSAVANLGNCDNLIVTNNSIGPAEIGAVISRLKPSLRTVVATGYQSASLVHEWKDLGVDTILSFPLDLKELCRSVK